MTTLIRVVSSALGFDTGPHEAGPNHLRSRYLRPELVGPLGGLIRRPVALPGPNPYPAGRASAAGRQ
jgi:hypothetical protein